MTLRLVAPLILLVALVAGGGSPAAASGSGDPADAPETTLRILAYNIHHGAGNDEVLDLQRIARLIRSLDPDLVALQEVDRRTARTGRVDQAAALGRMTGMDWAFGSFMEYEGGEYGMAVLSALPFVDSTNHRLPEGPEPRSSVAIRVQLPGGGGDVVFAGIHFYRTAEERMAQARRLLEVLEHEEGPVILAGDFNSTPDSVVMALIGATFTIPDKGEDHLTFSSDRPEREIDFIVYRPANRFAVVESRVVDEPVASDHRPVFLVLRTR